MTIESNKTRPEEASQGDRIVYDAWRGGLQNTKKPKDSVNDDLNEFNDSPGGCGIGNCTDGRDCMDG